MWVVFLLHLVLLWTTVYTVSFKSLGCWRDEPNRAIPTLEGQSELLDGHYRVRSNPIEKCSQVAYKRGYDVFAVQHGGWCASSFNARETYKKYGKSTNCSGDGEGGGLANDVYEFVQETEEVPETREYKGEYERGIYSIQPKTILQVDFRFCSHVLPHQANITIITKDKSLPHMFNTTVLEIRPYNVLTEVKRVDVEAGWNWVEVRILWRVVVYI